MFDEILSVAMLMGSEILLMMVVSSFSYFGLVRRV